MILVLIFFVVIILLTAIVIILSLSNLKIDIDNIYISNLYNKLTLNFTIRFKIYFLNKIKLLNIKIEQEKLSTAYKKNIKIFKSKDSNKINKEIIKMLLKSKYKIEKVDIKGKIGTENASSTAIIVGIVNALIPIVTIEKVDEENIQNYSYYIMPQYSNNIIDIKANITINIRIKEVFSNLIVIKKIVKS